LQAWGFESYHWSSGEKTGAILATSSGDYFVTVTDVQGCTATAVHHLSVSAMEVHADLLEPLCFGDENGEIHLSATGGILPYLASLNDGDFSEKMDFTDLPAGLYRLRVEDRIGCTDSMVAYLHSPPAFLLDMGGDLALELGESATLRATATLPISQYFWSPTESLNCHDCPSPVASPLSSTEYTLLAVSENGCEAEGQISVTVSKDEGLYVPTAFSPNGDGINDFFTLYPGRSVLKINQLAIFDRWGEEVFTVWNAPPYHPAAQWHGDFREQPMQPGVYVWFAEIEYIDGSTTLLKGEVVLVK
jgi:gliding motility-associated-like protein